jgi:hypothetical protein
VAIREFLTPEWVELQLEHRHGGLNGTPKSKPANLQAAVSTSLLKSIGRTDAEADWGVRLRQAMNRAELEHARGTPAAEIKQICRATVEDFLPQLATFDFTPRLSRSKAGCARRARRNWPSSSTGGGGRPAGNTPASNTPRGNSRSSWRCAACG